ncbi:hypothetical protein B0H14DRAFT_3549330 [Mycena olivaceomarginata]|nr:hypothetical protein B0H14DRAFT_3549330 [Mycena olivaceomarginata]
MSCPSKLDDTLGVLLVGTLVSYVLFGALTLQVHVYCGRFPQDSIKMKAMVGAVWCGEVEHAISLGMAVYTNLITYFGHPERHPPNSLLATILLGGLVSFSVQIFFAFRIYALSRSFWIPCICWALSCPPNVIIFAFIARETGFELVQSWAPLFIAIWAASAANDLLIAGTLVFFEKERLI